MTIPDRTCVRDGQIVCFDDLCRGTSRTICGLEEGIDFGVDEFEDYDEWDDDDVSHSDATAAPADAAESVHSDGSVAP